ncbi:hypothetical protein [Streptomyces sp. NPDC091268]|uniref:hypothetical protein n=1 Tax=Streptomyces sp. NPDC091268 TaxID=3365979 RepID=UPI0038068795
MLRTLSPAERAALLAHERAHLRGRHVFVAAVELAALCHPALRALPEPPAYALERWADESAAEAVGDRRVTARAIGTAALASRASRRPGPAPAATTGPVPRRVAALLQQQSEAARPAADPAAGHGRVPVLPRAVGGRGGARRARPRGGRSRTGRNGPVARGRWRPAPGGLGRAAMVNP